MFDNEINKYFDGIEPEKELVEGMVTMLKNNDKRRITISKRVIAAIAAVICILSAMTVSARIIRVHNDKNSVVDIDENNSFILNFENADRTPESLSNTNNDIVKALNNKGFKDVVIPYALIADGYKIDNEIDFIPQYTSAMYDFSDSDDNSVSMTIVQDIADEDINGFWGTGDENSDAQVVNVNSLDVVIAYMGDESSGYYSYIFYANGNTIYQITYYGGMNQESAKQKTIDFVNTLAQ